MFELWEIMTLTYVIVRGSECSILITIMRHWMSHCMPWRRYRDDQFICKPSSKALSIIISRRSTPIVKVAYLCALTWWIPEENWGKSSWYNLATICNLFAKSLCVCTSRRRCFCHIESCKDQGEHILKLGIALGSINSRSRRSHYVLKTCCTLFFLVSFSEVSHIKFLTRQRTCKCNLRHHALFLRIFPTGFFRSFNEAWVDRGIRPRGSVKKPNPN